MPTTAAAPRTAEANATTPVEMCPRPSGSDAGRSGGVAAGVGAAGGTFHGVRYDPDGESSGRESGDSGVLPWVMSSTESIVCPHTTYPSSQI
jgi:hypothetical protein